VLATVPSVFYRALGRHTSLLSALTLQETRVKLTEKVFVDESSYLPSGGADEN
jgi:hypothetical protein